MKRISTKRILCSKEFGKLKLVGGHKTYHLEGNAFQHSVLVWRASKKMFKGDSFMQLVALLHDIGKAETSVRNGRNDWSYPGHSKAGGDVLHRYIPKDHPRYKEALWYITNHIKPLFWNSKEDAFGMRVPEYCSIMKLAKLALCDLDGSYAIPEVGKQEDKRRLLREVAGIEVR